VLPRKSKTHTQKHRTSATLGYPFLATYVGFYNWESIATDKVMSSCRSVSHPTVSGRSYSVLKFSLSHELGCIVLYSLCTFLLWDCI